MPVIGMPAVGSSVLVATASHARPSFPAAPVQMAPRIHRACVCVQVLEELADIIDLPARAAMVEHLMAMGGRQVEDSEAGDGAGPGDEGATLFKAYEGLVVLHGTATNVEEAWGR